MFSLQFGLEGQRKNVLCKTQNGTGKRDMSWTVVVGINKVWNINHSNSWQHGGHDVKLPLQKPWFDSSVEPNLFSLIARKLACRNNGGGKSQGYVQVTSTDSCRMREIEGMRTVELVYVSRLLRMVILHYCLCGYLMETGSLAKEGQMGG